MVRMWPLCNIHVTCLPIKACSVEKFSKLSFQRPAKLGGGKYTAQASSCYLVLPKRRGIAKEYQGYSESRSAGPNNDES